ncbi:MAG: hypothetical protein RQ723_12365 [Desulfuromonadales bacterium]|nr:hypothetical protein [Desulfuromonadales bacterium]
MLQGVDLIGAGLYALTGALMTALAVGLAQPLIRRGRTTRRRRRKRRIRITADRRRDLVQWSCYLGAWACVTWGAASLTTPWLWPISFGVLVLMPVGGYRVAGILIMRGIVPLTRETED